MISILQEEVKKHEPLSALDGGRDGLDFYRTIVEQAADHLTPEGWLMMEIGHDQVRPAKNAEGLKEIHPRRGGQRPARPRPRGEMQAEK